MAKNSKSVTSSVKSKRKTTAIKVPPPPPPSSTSAQTGISFWQATASLLIFSVALFAISGWFWWHSIVLDPDRALHDMLARSLHTGSITHEMSQNDAQQSVQQLIQLDLSANPTAQSLVKIQQAGAGGSSSITTETIGTKQEDYGRYKAIDSTPPLDQAATKNVVGIWGARESGPHAAVFFDDAVFRGMVVPFGNLNSQHRQDLLDLMESKEVYHYTKVTRKSEGGRPVFVYELSIKPAALVEILADYSRITGYGNASQLDPKAYAAEPPINADMTVDALSRQLVSIRYHDTDRVEHYSGAGLKTPISVPAPTIPLAELQTRLQSLRQPQ